MHSQYADEMIGNDSGMSGRKVLKQDGDIQMWQESLDNRRHGPLFRYVVGSPNGTPQSFDTPREAWERFQSLVGTR